MQAGHNSMNNDTKANATEPVGAQVERGVRPPEHMTARHLKALLRRHAYLLSLPERNSYDKSELAALQWMIDSRWATKSALMSACNGLAVGLVLAQQRPGSADQMAVLSQTLRECQSAFEAT
jgi:hypothetical protein